MCFDCRHNMKLLRGYFLIVGSTFVTYFMPVSLFCAYLLHPESLPTLMKLRNVAGVLATVNNTMNPFVYFFCPKAFKDCVTKLVGRLARGHTIHESTFVCPISPPTADPKLPPETGQTLI